MKSLTTSRREISLLAYALLAAIWFLGGNASAVEPERLFYLSNGEVLQGLVYKPAGKGPFPAVVHNQHKSTDWAKQPDPQAFQELANFYTTRGYVLFLPGRRNWREEEAATNGGDSIEEQRISVQNSERQAEVVFAAIETLKAQAFINPRQIFVTGHAAGGTTALIMAQKPIDVRAYVLFSPGINSWNKNDVLKATLRHAARNAKVPVFLIQCENDGTLAPSEAIGKELGNITGSRTKIYPAFGSNTKDAGQFNVRGTEIWGDDVLSFFKVAGT